MFYGHNDLTKVSLSMARLLTVVNERKKLRSEFRIHLENEYIASQKAEELKQFMKQRETLLKQGVKNYPLTPQETRELYKKRAERQEVSLQEQKAIILNAVKNGEATLAPMVTELDVEFLASTRVKMS